MRLRVDEIEYVENHYTDEEGITYIDAYGSDDDTGEPVAYVDREKLTVTYRHPSYSLSTLVQNAINEVLYDIKKDKSRISNTLKRKI